MDQLAIDAFFHILDAVDTAAPGDRGIIREHVVILFQELNLNPNTTFEEFRQAAATINTITRRGNPHE